MICLTLLIGACGYFWYTETGKRERSEFQRHRQELVGAGSYIKVPRPADCKKMIAEDFNPSTNTMSVVYQTETGDVCVSKWKLVYEGTARLSESKMKKDKDVPIPVMTEGPTRGDAVDAIKKIVTGDEE